MRDWIPIGDPIPPALSPDGIAVQKFFEDNGIIDFPMKQIGKLCAAMKWGLGRALDAVHEVRKRESIMATYLDNTQKAAMYQMRQDGQTYAEIAKKFGVCPQTAANVCQRIDRDKGISSQPARKAGSINKEFDAAVQDMIGDAKKSANAEQNAANTEKISEITDPMQSAIKIASDSLVAIADHASGLLHPADDIPPVVRRAVLQHISDLEEEVTMKRERIEELKIEIAEYQKDLDAIRKWKEAHKL